MAFTSLGLQIPNLTFPGVSDGELFNRLAEVARTAERAGFDSLWVMDHLYQIDVVGPQSDPMLEAYTLLGGLAAATESALLGALVSGVTYRNPAVLAKQVTTLDVISSGRAALTLGAAWSEDEHRDYGIDFPALKERMDRLEEAVQICRLLLTEEMPSFTGRHYSIQHAINHPRPIQPHVPILIGGNGERRTLALVAAYADGCNLTGDLDTVRAKLRVLASHCERLERNPSEITRTRLGGLVIRETAREAERRARELVAARGPGLGGELIGDPAQVAEQAAEYRDAGIEGLIFYMQDAYNLELVEMAGEALKPLMNGQPE